MGLFGSYLLPLGGGGVGVFGTGLSPLTDLVGGGGGGGGGGGSFLAMFSSLFCFDRNQDARQDAAHPLSANALVAVAEAEVVPAFFRSHCSSIFPRAQRESVEAKPPNLNASPSKTNAGSAHTV